MTELPTRMSERFTLAELIGRGTCSSVFRARDELLDRDVAVKIFPVTDDPRVAREVSLMASLDHPALVPVYDVGEVDGRAFVVMALFDGGNLADRLAGGPLALTEALLTGSAVADALAHVHRAGVLHRDVIPRNVLFDADGRAHLSDFGVALVADAPRITDTGIVVGSAPYLAPEQVRGEAVGPTADVYALGLVTLEALTGTRAYPGAPLEAAQARLERRPAIPAELPDDVVALLDAMTADDPASRPDAEAACRRMRQAALASEIVDGDPRAALFADPAVTDLTVVAPAPRGAGLRHARRGTLVLGAATAAIMLASGVVIAATGPVGGVAATTPPGAALSAPALEAPAVPAPLLGGGSGAADSGDSADASQAADTPGTTGSGPTREQRASVVADSSPDTASDPAPDTAAVRRAEPDVRTTEEADRPARPAEPAEPAAPRSTDDAESPRSAPDDTSTTSESPSSSSSTTSPSSPTTSSSSPTTSSRDRDHDHDRDRDQGRSRDRSTTPREDRDDTESSREPSTPRQTDEPTTTAKPPKSGKSGKSDDGSSSTDESSSPGRTGGTGLVEALAQPVTRLLGQ